MGQWLADLSLGHIKLSSTKLFWKKKKIIFLHNFFQNSFQNPIQNCIQNALKQFFQHFLQTSFQMPFTDCLQHSFQTPFKFTFNIPSKSSFNIIFQTSVQNPITCSLAIDLGWNVKWQWFLTVLFKMGLTWKYLPRLTLFLPAVVTWHSYIWADSAHGR